MTTRRYHQRTKAEAAAAAVREQEAFIAERGNSRSGYIRHYGATGVPRATAVAIWTSDQARLDQLRSEAGL